MNTRKASGTLGLAILAILASPHALAADPGWYGGFNVGQSMATIDDERITSHLLGQGFTAVSIEDDDRDVGFKIFGGYQFNRHFAIEGGYFNLGEFGYTATTVPAGTLTGNIQLQGVNLDLLGIMPFTERLSAFARVGVNYAEAKDTFTSTGLVIVTNPNPSKRDTNHKFGVGLQYDLTERIGLRLEAERYRIDDAIGNKGDIDLASVGVVVRLGPPAVIPIAPAPLPPPVAVERCPPARPGQVIGPDGCPVDITIDLRGVNFDFDRSTLRPDAVATLNEATEILRRYPDLRVEVAGHTDLCGSDAYNQSLSERRARTVFDYLTGQTIDSGRLVGPVGYGESRPLEMTPQTFPECKSETNRRTELNVQN